MFGGIGKAGWATILVTGGLMLGASASAQAADLGGDCCGDLEERVAELEATTARKGNRKVKLEVSGQVNEAFIWWDDGVESNAGVYTNDNARTRFRFKGDAKITDDVKAGFLLEIGVRGANSKRFDQDDVSGCTITAPFQAPERPNCGLDVRHSVWYIDSKKYGRVWVGSHGWRGRIGHRGQLAHSVWYIDSKKYGRVWVGLTGGAGESVTEVNLAASKDVLKYSDIEDTGLGLFTRTANGTRLATQSGTSGRTGLEWRQLIRGGGDQPGEGRRWNMVRLDTPEIFGFVGTVNYGEDDTWEGACATTTTSSTGSSSPLPSLTVRILKARWMPTTPIPCLAIQCLGNNQSGLGFGTAGRPDTKCSQLGGSISVMHIESGIYGNFAAGYMEDDALKTDPGFQARQNSG